MSSEHPVPPAPSRRRRGCLLLALLGLLLGVPLLLWVRCGMPPPWFADKCLAVPPHGVSILVPEPKGGDINLIALSPDGTKLFYQFNFVQDLVTGETHQLPFSCTDPTWLDPQTLFCNADTPQPFTLEPTLIDVYDYSTIPVRAESAVFQDVATLLARPGQQVYELRDFPQPHVYLLRAEPPTESIYLFYVAEDLQASQNVAVKLPHYGPPLNVKVFSPNKQYYYIFRQFESLRMYHSAANRLVRDIEIDGGGGAYVEGWTYDSGGVIYLMGRGAISFEDHTIYKLNVPCEGQCWPWE